MALILPPVKPNATMRFIRKLHSVCCVIVLQS